MAAKKVCDHKGNEYSSLKDMCAAYGITPEAYNMRLKQMSQQKALEMPKKGKLNIIYQGKTYKSLKIFCEENGFSYGGFCTFSCRVKKEKPSISFEGLVKEYKEHMITPFVAPDGQEYQTVKEYCEKKGLDVTLAYSRKAQGKTEDEMFIRGNLKDKYLAVTDHKGNVFPTLKAKCEAYGISVGGYRNRVEKMRMTEEEALIKTPRTYKCIDHKGILYPSLKVMCEAYGISRDLYKLRIAKGMNQQEALETPTRNNRIVMDHLGNVYANLKEMLEAYEIQRRIYNDRKNAGWALEKILTTPLRHTAQPYIIPGYTFITACGLKAEVLSVNKGKALIRAEDGSEYERSATSIANGSIGHPVLSRNANNIFAGMKTKFLAISEDKYYYQCTCQKCGYKGILTPQQMIEHHHIHEE